METGTTHEMLAPGTLIAGKYAVERLLGEGGMGAVYQCVHTWTNRRVAVKLLRRELAARADVVDRFLLEARSSTRIAHPGVVEILDMGQDPQDPSQYFIAQELLEGETLRDRLFREKRMGLRAALEVLLPVLDALEAAHAQGVVHRDIKPENLFLSRSSRGATTKLIDFGISKWVGDDHDAPKHTQYGEAIGTPSYMSPEQVRGDVALDARTDVWSLGIVLYELLVGETPYEAATSNLVMHRVLSEDPAPLASRVPEIAPSFARVVHMALARDRDRRVASAARWRAELMAWVEAHAPEMRALFAQPPSVSGAPPASHVVAAVGTVGTAAPARATHFGWTRSGESPRARPLITGAMVSTVALTLLGGGLWFRARMEPTNTRPIVTTVAMTVGTPVTRIASPPATTVAPPAPAPLPIRPASAPSVPAPSVPAARSVPSRPQRDAGVASTARVSSTSGAPRPATRAATTDLAPAPRNAPVLRTAPSQPPATARQHRALAPAIEYPGE